MPFLDFLPDDAGPPAIYTRYPAIYAPWSAMSQELMNGESPLTQGERELVQAYAAAIAGCEFVYVPHAEVAYAWGIEDGLVERLLANPEDVSLEPRLRALLAFVRKLALTPNGIGQGDVDAVLAAGWDDRALHDAIAVTARAAFMHRIVAAFGFKTMSKEAARRKAVKRIEHGYVNLYPEFRKREQKP